MSDYPGVRPATKRQPNAKEQRAIVLANFRQETEVAFRFIEQDAAAMKALTYITDQLAQGPEASWELMLWVIQELRLEPKIQAALIFYVSSMHFARSGWGTTPQLVLVTAASTTVEKPDVITQLMQRWRSLWLKLRVRWVVSSLKPQEQ